MELFTVQQIIGCGDEDLGCARGCCTVRCAAASFCFSVFFILQKRRRAL